MKKALSRRQLLAGGAAFMGGVGLWCERPCTHSLRVERKTLKLPRWNAGPFTLAFMADLHVTDDESMAFAREAVTQAVAAKPNAIVFGGDFITNNRSPALPLVLEALAPLTDALCPCLGVWGNHDGALGKYGFVETVSRAGVLVLEDSSLKVGDVTFFGFRDALNGSPQFSAVQKLIGTTSTVVVLHEPDYVPFSPRWASLQLSGHSHGGQICLPFGIPLHCPEGGEKYVAGFYPDAPIPLYVTRGVGTTGPRLRLACPPELSLLTLRGRD